MIKNDIVIKLKNNRLSFTELVKKLDKRSDEVEASLEALQEEGVVFFDGKCYALLKDFNLKLAKVVLRKRHFVYVNVKDDDKDYRLSGSSCNGLILDDLIYIETKKNSSDCRMVGFYKRKKRIIGKFTLAQKIHNSLGTLMCKETGESSIKVIVESIDDSLSIRDYDTCSAVINDFDTEYIYVTIDEVLIHADEVGEDISSIIVTNGARLNFPKNVLDEAKEVPSKISLKDIDGREDIRKKNIITIDGDDALDFDDAVEVSKVNSAYLVGVHIADVSHYVKKNSYIDREAYERGTSIYVADRVVPMLPEELSNGICSLNPDVDRLVLSVYFYVDKYGNIFKGEIKESVICSKARMTYRKVNEILEGKIDGVNEETVSLINLLYEVSQKIRECRNRKGCLNLDSTEIKFHLDENGKPIDVIKLKQGKGERIIEDLMISANVIVANLFKDKGIPTLYRVHEKPPLTKVELLKSSLKTMNLINDFPSRISPESLDNWLSKIEDEKLKRIASGMLLRSLAKARYTEEKIPHFGLNEESYLHFTSPIRRYPDLIVHRLVKKYILDEHRFDKDELEESLGRMGDWLSTLERQAQSIEREVDDLESCKYFADRIGEIHCGVVVSITSYGMYIELENGIEVLLLSENISNTSTYSYDEKLNKYRSKTDREGFTLGSNLEVKIFQVDFLRKEVLVKKSDFDDSLSMDENKINMDNKFKKNSYPKEKKYDKKVERKKFDRNNNRKKDYKRVNKNHQNRRRGGNEKRR